MRKSIITGAPFSGKSTIVKILKKAFPSIIVKELDEMLIQMNNGTWPKNESYRNEILVPTVIKNVLNTKGNFLFFTTYISTKDIQKAKKKGFVLIQLSCPRKTLTERNVKKDKNRQYEMDRNLEYQKQIAEDKLIDKVIDCTQSPNELVELIRDYLQG